MNVMHPAIEELRSQLQGRVIEPGDPDYDQAKTVSYGGEERHPAAIARVASAEDVARVVTFTREMGLELAVRSEGHSVARHSVVVGGIIIDLGAMKGSSRISTLRGSNCGGEVRSRHRVLRTFGSTS